jgi:hypothetical protein
MQHESLCGLTQSWVSQSQVVACEHRTSTGRVTSEESQGSHVLAAALAPLPRRVADTKPQHVTSTRPTFGSGPASPCCTCCMRPTSLSHVTVSTEPLRLDQAPVLVSSGTAGGGAGGEAGAVADELQRVVRTSSEAPVQGSWTCARLLADLIRARMPDLLCMDALHRAR